MYRLGKHLWAWGGGFVFCFFKTTKVSKIKLFLETCDEMEIMTKYYEPEQIESGIKSFIDYYKNKEDKIIT
mgnify:CR=1 FL=1